MKNHSKLFTTSEIDHLLTPLLYNEQTGEYFGNKKIYKKRSKALREKLSKLGYGKIRQNKKCF